MFNLQSNSEPNAMNSFNADNTNLSPSPFDQIMLVEEVSPQTDN
jgi:hypothetical protein